MMKTDIINEIRKDLIEASDETTRISGERFFKEAVKLYGVKTALVQNIAKEYFKKFKEKEKAEVFELCDELWESGYLEESFIACSWSYSISRQFGEEDFKYLEYIVNNHITNWASCDTFCNHTIGTFIEMYPAYIKELKKWASSNNRWTRRAAAVSLIIPARKGMFLKEIFEIADIMLTDKEDMVQKGYGWMLKVASQTHEKEVFEYVMKNKAVMPRTALRYAIEKMPTTLKKEAMAKF